MTRVGQAIKTSSDLPYTLVISVDSVGCGHRMGGEGGEYLQKVSEGIQFKILFFLFASPTTLTYVSDNFDKLQIGRLSICGRNCFRIAEEGENNLFITQFRMSGVIYPHLLQTILDHSIELATL